MNIDNVPLQSKADAFEYADQVLEKWYPTVEEGSNKGIVVLVTTQKEGAVTGGPAFIQAVGENTLEATVSENLPGKYAFNFQFSSWWLSFSYIFSSLGFVKFRAVIMHNLYNKSLQLKQGLTVLIPASCRVRDRIHCILPLLSYKMQHGNWETRVKIMLSKLT